MLWGADRAGVGDEVGARLDLEVELAPVLRRELLEHLFRACWTHSESVRHTKSVSNTPTTTQKAAKGFL